ncbi:MAG: ribosome biogenesis GTP-binding protein YihA/YsxC [Mycoplasmataceae bacterium]|jgi:GTP-binding protein|nr:ribosome biogenesis GTP-binding protein YihA/YsxC [Mycoplasmataceae bacterium]
MPHFIKSAITSDGYINDAKNEVCLIGRSNVGKSTLINALANKKIAFSSKTPGRTQTINYYDFDLYRLVDLPGYGYAKVSFDKKAVIANLLDNYINNSKNLFVVLHVCDANVITTADIKMSQKIQKKFTNYFVVLNKIDKKNINQYKANTNKYLELFKIKKDQLFFVSAKNKTNIPQLKQQINELI